MLPTLHASLPYTLALAVLAYLAFSSVLPNLELPQEYLIVIGVLSSGILVPVLIDVKGSAADANVATGVAADYQGDTTTLYVGNLPYRANENEVKQLFSEHGEVFAVRLMKDKRTGKRRGFGFVVMNSKDAENAITHLNNKEYGQRTLKVREANEPKAEDNEEM